MSSFWYYTFDKIAFKVSERKITRVQILLNMCNNPIKIWYFDFCSCQYTRLRNLFNIDNFNLRRIPTGYEPSHFLSEKCQWKWQEIWEVTWKELKVLFLWTRYFREKKKLAPYSAGEGSVDLNIKVKVKRFLINII